jgi:hypothetical protein
VIPAPQRPYDDHERCRHHERHERDQKRQQQRDKRKRRQRDRRQREGEQHQREHPQSGDHPGELGDDVAGSRSGLSSRVHRSPFVSSLRTTWSPFL